MKFRHKSIFLFLIVGVLSAAAGAVLIFHQNDEDTQRQGDVRLGQLADKISSNVKNFFAAANDDLKSIVANPEFFPAAKEGLEDRLTARCEKSKFDWLCVLDAEGQTVASTGPVPPRLAQGPLFGKTKRGSAANCRIMEFPMSKKTIIVMAAPLTRSKDKVEGVLYATIAPAMIHDAIVAAGLFEGVNFVLTDDKGTTIASSCQRGGGYGFVGGEQCNSSGHLTAQTKPVNLSFLEIDGMPDMTVVVVAAKPQEPATATAMILGWVLLSGGATMILATLAFSFWKKFFMSVPIRQMTERMQEISRGEYYGRTVDASGDELGKLADAFNLMSRNVKFAIEASLQREDRLREFQKNQAVVLDSIIDAVIITDSNGMISRMNTMAAKLTGWQADHARGRKLSEVFRVIDSSTGELEQDPFLKVEIIGRFSAKNSNLLLECRDGSKSNVSYGASPVYLQNGQFDGIVLVFRDVSEEYRMQARIQRSQKFESLGVMAGGVAHDFNNMLSSIMGNADLALMQMEDGSFIHQRVKTVRDISVRASELTRQLLVYSGKERTIFEPMEVNSLIEEMARIVEVSIPKNVTIRMSLAPNLPPIQADASQIRQVVMNLIINASQSLGGQNGCIEIRTCVIDIDTDQIMRDGAVDFLSPGRHVCIDVIDNGCGMDQEVVERIFEPFYTTKETGRGLGLASSMGIIKAHHGDIRVSSRRGEGSIFSVLLPVVDSSNQAAAVSSSGGGAVQAGDAPTTATLASETDLVLIIDDEAHVRKVARLMLQHSGFKVVEASCGREGLEILRQKASQVRAVLLDMSMPQMSGQETFAELRRFNQTVPVIIISGCVEQQAISPLLENHGVQFIRKPFLYKELVGGVENIIHSPQPLEEEDSHHEQN